MKTFSAAFLVLSLLVLPALAQPAAAPAPQYELTVKFGDAIEIKTKVTVGHPFAAEVKNPKGIGDFGISGVLLHPVDGKFRLQANTVQWYSDTTNSVGTTSVTLTLDKTANPGSAIGDLGCTYTLTKIDSPK